MVRRKSIRKDFQTKMTTAKHQKSSLVLHQEKLDGNVSELRAPYFAVYRIPKHTKELAYMAPEFGFSTPAFPLIEA